MRLLAVPALALILLSSCARHQPTHTPSTATTALASATTPPAPTTPDQLPPNSSVTLPAPTRGPQTEPATTTSPALIWAPPASVSEPPSPLTTGPTGDPLQVATSFVRAALDANVRTLTDLSQPSYAEAARRLWISDSGPSNQPILAAKVLTLAAGHARVAVFVDAGDLVIAALPYTVELAQDPATGLWSVIDAGLSQP